jgi:SAM-dependent methyltransferase
MDVRRESDGGRTRRDDEQRATASDEQVKLWNGPAGRTWVEKQPVLDEMFRPIEQLLVEQVVAKSSERVLDVGCGTGSTTLAVARRIGMAGQCVGVDLSEPMIALARARVSDERERLAVRFICGDAQTLAFEPASFDMFISRFGVMFFEHPVRAFANLRHAARDGAELRFAVWRGASENPFMTAAERAAAPLLPELPPRRADAPGQFALADPRKVSSIFEDSGWADIDLQPVDVECSFPESELGRYVTRMGPVGLFLQQADDQTRKRVIPAVQAAFEPFVYGAEVRFTAACWMICARAPAASASASA